MARLYAVPVTLRPVFFAVAGLSLLCTPIFSQMPEADPTVQPASGPGNLRDNDKQRHDAGSVEATAPAMRDRLFLREATLNEMALVRFSELATRRASGDDVKQFATLMITDHGRISESLKSAAETEGVMLPTKPSPRDEAVYEKLQALSGEDFDREYIKTLVENHHKELREFRSEAANTQNATLRGAVQDGAAMIHHQIGLTDQIARTKGIEISRPVGVAASSSQQ